LDSGIDFVWIFLFLHLFFGALLAGLWPKSMHSAPHQGFAKEEREVLSGERFAEG
jgi:hypothetical protein